MFPDQFIGFGNVGTEARGHIQVGQKSASLF